jgi:RNA polymerase sigma factor (sigma-70 family)
MRTAAASRSDETARLYERYGRQLYRYCLSRLRSPEEAEDAVQNTFIRVHRALAQGVTPRFETAWLYKIAHNVCLTRSEINVHRAHNERPTDFSELELPAPEVANDALRELEEALASMPKNLRDAILLREWQGLSYAEIADSLDTSVSAVETRIFRARRHLVATLRPALELATMYGVLRTLLARLRSAAATAGPAKVAAGAAVLALGGAGVSTGVTVAGDKPHSSPPSVLAPAPRPGRTTAVARAVPPAATVVAVAPKTTSRSSPSASVTRAAPITAPEPVATAPESGTATPTAPPPVATQTTSEPPLPTPTATVPENAPAIPTSIELPAVTTPILTTPSVTVEVPTVQLPVVQLPALPVTISTPTLPGIPN